MQQPGRPAGPQLPSIRTLHPYLPPPAAMESTTLPTPTLPTPTMPMPMMTFSAHGAYPPSSYADSDADERDPSGDAEPPKKKRRRQALSCTECKRRKIRCDRTQPCAPCVRRGDQAKCQWNVVEPATEKYVPRAEYDALHRRVDMLEDALRSRIHAFEDYVYRLPPHVLASHPLPPHLLPHGYPGPSQAPFIAPPQPFDPRHSPHSPYAPQPFTAPIPQSFAPGGTQSFVSPSTSSFPGPSSSSGGIPPSMHLHQSPHLQPQQQQHPPLPRSASFSPTHARRPSFSPTTSTSPALRHRSSGSVPQYTQQQQHQMHGAPPPGSGSLPAAFTLSQHPSSSSEIHARSVSGSGSGSPVVQTRARRTGSVSSHPEVSSSAGHQPFPVGQGSWGTGGDTFPPHSASSSSPSIPVTTTYSSHGNAGGGGAGGGGIGSQGQGPSQGQAQGQGGMGMGTYSASTSSSSLAPSTGGRTSAGSLSSFTSSASSATPTTLSIPSSLPPPYSAGFHGGGGRGGGGGGAVTATRIVRPELSVSVDLMKNNSKRKRELEDAREGGRDESPDPSKNPYAQALQGARLRSRHRAPWLPLPALHPVVVRVPPRAVQQRHHHRYHLLLPRRTAHTPHALPQHRRATGEIEARSGSPHRGGGDALTSSASSPTVAVTLPSIHTISVAESSTTSTSADPSSSSSSHRMSGGRGGLDAGQSREPQPGSRYRSTSASEGSAWAWRGTPPTTQGRGCCLEYGYIVDSETASLSVVKSD
ncbi:hypothetical protein R3P38DRAFT_3374799 [Favolaschia claudopus]|uniref:Zn(2)-C6 fungal-type domain-containing protein n=1 Tax=Favolaschia claudopus TaxID=2862362 RepID=A0AAV9ZL25_9AGAR